MFIFWMWQKKSRKKNVDNFSDLNEMDSGEQGKNANMDWNFSKQSETWKDTWMKRESIEWVLNRAEKYTLYMAEDLNRSAQAKTASSVVVQTHR